MPCSPRNFIHERDCQSLRQLGADVDLVRQGIGSDTRIGYSFIFPGVGYGGGCFPKDVQALLHMGENTAYLCILQAVEEVNYRQKRYLIEKVLAHYQHSIEEMLCHLGAILQAQNG